MRQKKNIKVNAGLYDFTDFLQQYYQELTMNTEINSSKGNYSCHQDNELMNLLIRTVLICQQRFAP